MKPTSRGNRHPIGIRVDGGHTIGLGHVYKTLELAEALKAEGCDPQFFATNDTIVRHLLQRTNFSVQWLAREWDESQKIEWVNEWVKKNQPAALIIDHWDWSDVYWKYLNTRESTLSVAVDVPPEGFSKFHLAFQGIRNNLRNMEYEKNGCAIFEGPKYLMVSSRYDRFVQGWNPTGKLESVLLTFGGTDVADFSLEILDRFEKIPGAFHLTLVSGPGSSNFEAAKFKAQSSRHKIEVLREVNALPELMCQSDLAITTAGLGTLSELALTGTPAIVFAAVDHQIDNADKFAPVGGIVNCAKVVRMVDPSFENRFNALVRQPDRLAEMSCRWRGLVDANGIGRMTTIIMERVRGT